MRRPEHLRATCNKTGPDQLLPRTVRAYTVRSWATTSRFRNQAVCQSECIAVAPTPLFLFPACFAQLKSPIENNEMNWEAAGFGTEW